MSQHARNRKPTRLDPIRHELLRWDLGRGAGRCQPYGTRWNLEVHHRRFSRPFRWGFRI